MKFLCDRCKTRYSIADERVRGKILKIRCKNCANVITVREGMEEAPAEVRGPSSGGVAARSRRDSFPTPAAGRPLEAAFASAMSSSPGIKVAPAPAALEEEWYVSIDGTQSGPFSLAQAQAWVAGRGNGEELYCWSEGFDDWLPVEKVSHFRGIRGRSRPRTEPPPIPNQDSGRHLRPQPEPQPLFAAALAALDNDGATAISAPPIKLEDMIPRPAFDPRNGKPAVKQTPAPVAARPLPGPGVSRTPVASSPVPAVGSSTRPNPGAATPASSPIPMFGKASPAPPSRGNGTNGHDAPPRPMFDGGLDDDGTVDDGLPDALSAGAARAIAPEPSGGDDLDIGEVSRVVRIADLGKTPATPRRTPVASPIARGTGGVPKLEQAALAASGDALAPQPLLMPGSEVVPPPAPKTHNVLLAIGIGAVALVATLIIVFAVQGGDEGDDGLGPKLDQGEDLISNVSVDVQVTALPKPDPGPDPTPGPGPGPKPVRPRNNGGTSGGGGGGTTPVLEPDRSGLTALSVDEVDAMSRRMSTGPRRCYEQATKKDPFLEVKTIKAVITIDKSGMVSKVELLNRANDHLDGCLAGAIKRWKFRENSEGLATQISFVFASS